MCKQSSPLWNKAQADESYYTWLGNEYAYENYMYLAYSAQLLSYFQSVASCVWTSESATAQWVQDYYSSSADYYYNLIYPAS